MKMKLINSLSRIALFIAIMVGVSTDCRAVDLVAVANEANYGGLSTLPTVYSKTGINLNLCIENPYWFKSNYAKMYLSFHYVYIPFDNTPEEYIHLLDESHGLGLSGDPLHIMALDAELYVFPWYEKTKPFFPFASIGLGDLQRFKAEIRSSQYEFLNATVVSSNAMVWTLGLGTDIKITDKLKLRIEFNSLSAETKPSSVAIRLAGVGVIYSL